MNKHNISAKMFVVLIFYMWITAEIDKQINGIHYVLWEWIFYVFSLAQILRNWYWQFYKQTAHTFKKQKIILSTVETG